MCQRELPVYLAVKKSEDYIHNYCIILLFSFLKIWSILDLFRIQRLEFQLICLKDENAIVAYWFSCMNIHSVSLYFSKTLFSVTLLSFIFFGPAANAKEQISISWHMLYLCMRRQNILWFRQGMQKNHKMIQKFKSIIHDDDDLTIYSYTFFGFCWKVVDDG